MRNDWTDNTVGRSPVAATRRLRFGSGRNVRIWTVLTIVAIAVAGVLAYWEYSALNTGGGGSTRGPAMVPIAIQKVTTVDNLNGPGGCAAPGAGHTEYCYSFMMTEIAGLAIGRADPPSGSIEFLTTSELTFQLQDCSRGGPCTNVTFPNVTLLSGSAGKILASFSVSLGWSAFAGGSLPIQISNSQYYVLNAGEASVGGDYLVLDEPGFGSASSGLS